ncbi:peptidase inhibitor family I36 protein [Streptomyces sp. NBC_00572]|uniref:peptidase inhibitor family I36 protein n=1 Tax=Streptomyces sp. NBC_00572 TaxID=2903664 RepID=UPI0022538CEC|nr:peptidase inhibitor family I36 protein [Streptomyces sp. NBC_00572]MCX4980610.1 peptidase inhibitor family I36 protein [Streptomyces sp. NBC_00572]
MSENKGLRRRLAAAVTSTALLFGAGVATASTAAAAEGPECDAGYHCAFYLYVFGGASHQYFNSDANFTNDTFDVHNQFEGYGYGQGVNDRVSGASNSSTGGYESHYYRDINYGGGLAFCVNPGSSVSSTSMSSSQINVASSLLLRPTTSVHCY